MHFRALARIARGEEIWSSYTPLGWPLHEPSASPSPSPAEEEEEEEEDDEEEEVSRARHLASNYGFQCGCRRCLIEDGKAVEAPEEGEEPQLRLALWLLRHVCAADGCGGTMVPASADAFPVAAATSALPTSAQALQDALRPLTGDWSRGSERGLACNGCGRVQSEVEFRVLR